MFGGGERVSEAVLCQTLDIAIDIRVDQPIGSAGVDSRRSGGYDGVSEVTILMLLLTHVECHPCRARVHWCFRGTRACFA